MPVLYINLPAPKVDMIISILRAEKIGYPDKILAIKLLREISPKPLGLREAKDAIEYLGYQLGVYPKQSPDRSCEIIYNGNGAISVTIVSDIKLSVRNNIFVEIGQHEKIKFIREDTGAYITVSVQDLKEILRLHEGVKKLEQ